MHLGIFTTCKSLHAEFKDFTENVFSQELLLFLKLLEEILD
jgi:hypothetical protein